MQIFYYFCSVKKNFILIWILFLGQFIAAEEPFNFPYGVSRSEELSSFNLDEVVLDIYNSVSELSEVDYEQLQTDLYALHEAPIDLNATSDEELSQLYFLSPKQIDDILMYADKHPFESLYELRMIPSLSDYEIRDLLPFVRVSAPTPDTKLYAREVFAQARHELTTRVDVRDIESFEGPDPVFFQTRYRFDYQRKVLFGGQLKRPVSGEAKDLQYGLYLQLRDIAPHVHTIVAGNYQASFGQGLVLAPAFHAGKGRYVSSIGQQTQGLRYYSSVDGTGLHGVGTTLRWEWNKSTRLDASVLYSMNRHNDTTWQHVVGANLTLRHRRLEIQLTGIEHLWSDSIHPYRNAKYNRHYFRGRNQFVGGASLRYNYGWFDLFGEVATAQNHEIIDVKAKITREKWGFATIVGSRFYPTDGVSLIALYRYYSPFFDNTLGYGFSETSRINDENGGYLGFDITHLRNWRFTGYGDVFYFSGYKYGLGDATQTLGYDAMLETQYIRDIWRISLRARAKKKGEQSTYSTRLQFDWSQGGWSLRTTADANYVQSEKVKAKSERIPYGISLAQDVRYTFSKTPLSLLLRAQFFDARNWENRIYLYEHDVLYAFSIPATYGLGFRTYLCLQYQMTDKLSFYLRASETVKLHTDTPSKTDFHLLMRLKI